MARATVSKPYNNGQWSVARFNAFIKGALRSASNRWGPKFSTMKKARVDRGVYRCIGYLRDSHNVRLSVKSKRNVYVDHIHPVIDPSVGFMSWDETIKRMFVEENGLQVLCKECHDNKTKEERAKRNDTSE